MSLFQQHMSAMQRFDLGLGGQFAGKSLGLYDLAALGRQMVRAFPDYDALQESFEKEIWETTL